MKIEKEKKNDSEPHWTEQSAVELYFFLPFLSFPINLQLKMYDQFNYIWLTSPSTTNNKITLNAQHTAYAQIQYQLSDSCCGILIAMAFDRGTEKSEELSSILYFTIEFMAGISVVQLAGRGMCFGCGVAEQIDPNSVSFRSQTHTNNNTHEARNENI